MEHKGFPTEFKVDHPKRIIEGYASTFGNVDKMGDVVVRGAYARTLTERLPAGNIKFKVDHKHVIGKPLHAEEDSTGLFTRNYVSKTPRGDEILTLTADGVIGHMSIAYKALSPSYGRQGNQPVRFIKEARLADISVMTEEAANDSAEVLSVKSLADLDDLLRAIPGAIDFVRAHPEELKSLTANLTTTAALLRQSADDLLALPVACHGEQELKSTATEDTGALLAIQSIVRDMTDHFRRAA